MSLPVRTTPLADLHILELDTWWRSHREGAPDLFAEELANALSTLGLVPRTGHRVSHPATRDLRRLLLRATRNHIYYVVRSDHVLVVAVWGAIKGVGPDLGALTSEVPEDTEE